MTILWYALAAIYVMGVLGMRWAFADVPGPRWKQAIACIFWPLFLIWLISPLNKIGSK